MKQAKNVTTTKEEIMNKKIATTENWFGEETLG